MRSCRPWFACHQHQTLTLHCLNHTTPNTHPHAQVYDARRFTSGGFQHHELYFPDGSCPSQDILLSFLDLAEQTPGCLAIHCKAGLGRTGVLICSYLMKHYRWARVCLGVVCARGCWVALWPVLTLPRPSCSSQIHAA
jgi:hypothetical protein